MNGLRISLIGIGVAVLAAGLIFGATTASVPGARSEHPINPKIGDNPGNIRSGETLMPAKGHELAAFSGGCFWGTEDEFRQVPGVVATAVGFTGGTVPYPSYEQVCTHTTGHAETV